MKQPVPGPAAWSRLILDRGRLVKPDIKIYFKLVLTTFFWGGTFVSARYAVSEVSPFFAATCRFAIASTVLFAIMFHDARRNSVRVPAPASVKEILGLGALGLTGVFCYNAFFFVGLKYTGAANGSLIAAINPLLTAVIAAWWLRERIIPAQLIGLLVSLCGVGMIVTRGDMSVVRSLSFNQGDLMLLGAPLSWAVYSVLGRKVLGTFAPLAATAYATLFGTLLLIPAAWVEFATGRGAYNLSLAGWLAILQLSLLGTVIGFVWWYQAVKRLGAGRAALFINLVPFFGTLLAALVLGEYLQWPQLWGGVLVIAGVFGGSFASWVLDIRNRAERYLPD